MPNTDMERRLAKISDHRISSGKNRPNVSGAVDPEIAGDRTEELFGVVFSAC